MRNSSDRYPVWIVIVGLAIGGLLIFLARPRETPAGLSQQFAPRPPDPSAPTSPAANLPSVSLPSLPPDAQRTVQQAIERLAGGQAISALTPIASSARATIAVSEVKRDGDRVKVRGAIRSIGGEVAIPPGAFSFRDSDGVLYSTAGTGGATLKPGEDSNFDLTVPLPPGRGLTMILDIPPDQPIEQVLLLAVTP